MSTGKRKKFNEISQKYTGGSVPAGTTEQQDRKYRFETISKKYQPKASEANPVITQQNLHEKSLKKVADYESKRASGGYLSKDDLDNYQKAVIDFISTGDSIRQYNKENGGMYTHEEDAEWESLVANLATSVGSYRDMYSEYADEAAWKRAVENNKEYIKSFEYDVDAGKEHLFWLQGQIDKAKKNSATPIHPAYAMGAKNGIVQIPDDRKQAKTDLESLQKQYAKLESKIKQAEHNQAVRGMEQRIENADGYAKNSKYVQRLAESDHGTSGGPYDVPTDQEYKNAFYEAVNQKPGAAERLRNMTMALGGGSAYYANAASHPELAELDPQEIQTFNAIAATEGDDAAMEYYELITEDLTARRQARNAKKAAEFAQENPYTADFLSVAASPLKGYSYLVQGIDYLTTGKIDENAAYNDIPNISSSIRSERGSQVASKWESVLGSKGWGKVGEYGYQLGMSMADFLTTAAVSGGNETMALAIMGTGAAADSTIAAKNRGLDDSQAIALGTIAGAAEAVSEKIGWDALFDSALRGKSPVIYLLKNAFSEGLEEPTSSLINTIADLAISGDKAELRKAVQEYVDSGIPVNEAWGKVIGEYALSLGTDAIGGLLSGGLMGGGSVAVGAISSNAAYKKTGKEMDIHSVLQAAEEFSGDKKIKKLTSKVSQKNASAADVGKLYYAVTEKVQEQTQADFETALEEAGTQAEDVKTIADLFTRSAMGMDLTEQEIKIRDGIAQSEKYRNVYNTVMSEDSNTTKRLQRLGDATKTKATANAAANAKAAPEASSGAQDAAVEFNAPNQTFVESSGEAVHTMSVSKIDGKNVTVTVNGNTDVPLNDVSMASEATAFAYQTVTQIKGMTPKAANLILQNVESEDDGYLARALKIYDAGIQNDQQLYSRLDPEGKALFMAAREAAQAKAKAAEAELYNVYMRSKGMLEKTGKKVSSGKLRGAEGVDVDGFNDQQLAASQVAAEISPSLSLDVVLYEDPNPRKFGYYKGSEDAIYINVNARWGGNSMMVYTLAHELVHRGKKGSPRKFKKFADFLVKEYGKAGVSVEDLIAEQMAAAKAAGETLTEDEAFEEVICDAAQRMLTDTDAGKKLAAWGQQSTENRSFLNDLKQWLTELFDNLRALFQDAENDSDAARAFRKLDKNVQNILADLFVDMSTDAAEKLGTIKAAGMLDKINTTGDGGVRYSLGITEADIQAVQNIGGISVNQFSPADIKATERFAQQYWKEMGVKSPFFRAWFGDWRANDQTKVQVATQRGDTRGVQKNTDTGWDIQVSGQVFNETKVHQSAVSQKAVPYLPFINDIVKKAVLLDTLGLDDAKSVNSLLMHNMYAVADIGSGPEVLRLYVEEMNDPNQSDTKKRAYQLHNIEKAFNASVRVQGKTPSSLTNTSNAIRTVADLFAAVKQKDSSFQPKAASKIVDADGKPLVMYHGTKAENGDFYIFDEGQAKKKGGLGFKALGKGNYFTATKLDGTERYGSRVIAAYLNIKTPFVYEGGMSFREQVFKDLGIDAESMSYDEIQKTMRDAGYDGVIQYDKAGNIQLAVTFDSNQIKSATENIGTFDGGTPDIRHKLAVGAVKREMLADAFEELVASPEDRRLIDTYRNYISTADEIQQQIEEARAQIRQKVKDKAPNSEIAPLRQTVNSLQSVLDANDEALLSLEATAPLKKIMDRAVKKATSEQRKEMTAKYQESRKKAVEGRRATELRNKIRRLKQDLQSTMLHPTDGKYIPGGLFDAMVEVCNLIDTDTDLYKKDGSVNKAQLLRDQTKVRLEKLSAEYNALERHPDGAYQGEFDEYISKYLEDIRNNFSGKSLMEMNTYELGEFYDILKSIKDTIADARQLIGLKESVSIYEVADATDDEQKRIRVNRRNGERSWLGEANDNRMLNILSPMRNVERMSGYNQDSAFLGLFREIEAGMRKKNFFKMNAYKMFEELSSGKQYEDAVYKPFGNEYTDKEGRKFRVSKMQMMQAILSYEREQSNINMRHVDTGGFSFADLSLLEKGNMQKAVSKEHSHDVPAAGWMVAEFNEALKGDAWAQKYMETARKFFNGMAKNAINETTMLVKHRIVAKGSAYIPFTVDRTNVVREVSEMDQVVQKTINQYGMLQEIKKNAQQALIITGLNNIIDQHIDQVGTVYGLAVPVRNFNKVWNTKANGSTGEMVKGIIEKTWGKSGAEHIEQAVKDVQGPRKTNRNPIYSKIRSNYINSTFLLNGSVVSKQIGSLFAANSALDRMRNPLAMLGNLLYTGVRYKEISAKVDKYSATAWMRRQGLSDAEIATLLTERRKGWISKGVGKVADWTGITKAITAMDSAVALSLWKYCEQDVKARTGLTGEALMQATAEHFDNVVETTQSMSDELHRPEFQKTDDIVKSTFAMFKTDLFQMVGNLNVAAGRTFANPTSANKKALARVVTSVAFSALWAQMITLLFAAIRYKPDRYRDENGDITWKSVSARILFDLAAELAGYFAPLIGGEVVEAAISLKTGRADDLYSDMTFSAVNDLWSTTYNLLKKATDDEKKVTLEDYKKLSGKALSLLGFPANNVLRLWDAIAKHVKDAANGEFLSFEAGAERSAKQYTGKILDAYGQDGKQAAAVIFEDALDEIAFRKAKGEEVTDDHKKEAKSALKTEIGKMYRKDDIDRSTVEKIMRQVFKEDPDDTFWSIDRWDYMAENKTSDGYSKYAKLISAVKTGNRLDSVVSWYTNHGVDPEDLASEITKEFKKSYLNLSGEKKARMLEMLVDGYVACGVRRSDAIERIGRWKEKEEED